MITTVLIIVIVALIIALIASNWESMSIPARKGFIEDENGVNHIRVMEYKREGDKSYVHPLDVPDGKVGHSTWVDSSLVKWDS
jgi:hypothetical protein